MHLRQYAILFFLIIPIVLLINSCTKQETVTPQKETAVKFVDPVKDLAGFLDPFAKTLFVLADTKDSVLNILGAKPVGDGMYTMNSATGKKVQMNFMVSVVNSPSVIYFYIDAADRSWRDWYADRDPERGELIDTTMDRHGTFYRVYRNAECSKIQDASVTECGKQIKWGTFTFVGPESTLTTTPPVETGKYIKTERFEISHCLKGAKYCVEALVIVSRISIYNDPNCTQMLETYPGYYDYSCIR